MSVPVSEIEHALRAVLARHPAWSHLRIVHAEGVTVLCSGTAAQPIEHARLFHGGALELCLAEGRWHRVHAGYHPLGLVERLESLGAWAFQPLDRARCPVCDTERAFADEPHLDALDRALHEEAPGRFFPGLIYRRVRDPQAGGWACGACLRAGRALPADPARQVSSACDPVLAYYPLSRSCTRCGAVFCYSAQEQKHRYEARGQYLEKRPDHCPDCRRAHVERARTTRELSQALATVDRGSPESLLQLAVLQARLGHRDKALLTLRQACNRARAQERLAPFAAQVDALRAAGEPLPELPRDKPG